MSVIALCKRPRAADCEDEDEYMSEHMGKRQCSLPLRTSPSSSPQKHYATPPSPPRRLCAIPTTLTPAESSHSDVADNRNGSYLSGFNAAPSSRTSAFPTARVKLRKGDGLPMVEMPPPPIDAWRKPVVARRRANGISSGTTPMPINFSTDADQTDANGGRVPTPIYGHFASTDVNMDTSEAAMNSFIHPAARFQLRHHQQNVLSPMMSEDGESEADWWRRRQLPSPADSPIMGQRMEMDEVMSPGIGDMDILSFDNVQAHNSHMNDAAQTKVDLGDAPGRQIPTPTSTRSSSKGHAIFERQPSTAPTAPPVRKGKLVMGFRPGCGKCQNRTLGHYSHIVWS